MARKFYVTYEVRTCITIFGQHTQTHAAPATPPASAQSSDDSAIGSSACAAASRATLSHTRTGSRAPARFAPHTAVRL